MRGATVDTMPDPSTQARTLRSQPTLDAVEILHSLFTDAGAAVAVYERPALRAISMNDALRRRVGSKGPDAGERLWDHLPPAVANDRRPLIEDALDSNTPLRMVGMVRGRWTQSVYRPMTTDEGQPVLLMVCAPVTEANTEDGEGLPTVRARVDDLGDLERLTEREIEVLRFIGLGFTSEQIAKTLHRSVKTVQGHRNALGLKLQIDNRVALARIAIDAGLTLLTADEVTEAWRRGHASAAPSSDPDTRPEINTRPIQDH
jgi:DNA-binding CsgD family transcriptional regulator